MFEFYNQIIQLINYRWWWQEADETDEDVQFLWTSQASSSFLNKQRSRHISDKIEFQPFEQILKLCDNVEDQMKFAIEQKLCLLSPFIKIHNHVDLMNPFWTKKNLIYRLKKYCTLTNQNFCDFCPFSIIVNNLGEEQLYEFIRNYKTSTDIWIVLKCENEGQKFQVCENTKSIFNFIHQEYSTPSRNQQSFIIQQYIRSFVQLMKKFCLFFPIKSNIVIIKEKFQFFCFSNLYNIKLKSKNFEFNIFINLNQNPKFWNFNILFINIIGKARILKNPNKQLQRHMHQFKVFIFLIYVINIFLTINLYAQENLMSIEDKTMLKDEFMKFDLNKDGLLTKEELLNVYSRTLPHQRALEEVNDIFKKINVNGGGKIDYQEFVIATIDQKKYFNKEKLMTIFQQIDSDHNGELNKEEIKNFLIQILQQKYEQLSKKLYQNCDG